MRIWIDLANSPHPLLFEPISRELEDLGHEVIFTVRDNAQTADLARARWPDVELIGSESPGGRAAKAAAIAERMRNLRRWARGRHPDVALSHNSYAQIVAARTLRLPAITAMDFEHQPSNHLAFRAASLVVLPEPLPTAAVRRYGARPGKVAHYPGLKEHIQLADFTPDPDVVRQFGLEPASHRCLVVVRTPPSRAIYHQDENPVFVPLLRHIAATPDTVCVVLARHPEQRQQIAALGLEPVRVPDRAIDSRSLMFAADAVFGAGGTMTREAALLGVPTYSLFSGRRPAVDLWLERAGLLTQIRSREDFPAITARAVEPTSLARLHEQSEAAISGFVQAVVRRSASG